MDGGHALQDEAAEERRHRNGIARPRIQHDPRDEDYRYPGPGCRDEGLKSSGLAKNRISMKLNRHRLPQEPLSNPI